jgi:hypothetical protein
MTKTTTIKSSAQFEEYLKDHPWLSDHKAKLKLILKRRLEVAVSMHHYFQEKDERQVALVFIEKEGYGEFAELQIDTEVDTSLKIYSLFTRMFPVTLARDIPGLAHLLEKLQRREITIAVFMVRLNKEYIDSRGHLPRAKIGVLEKKMPHLEKAEKPQKRQASYDGLIAPLSWIGIGIVLLWLYSQADQWSGQGAEFIMDLWFPGAVFLLYGMYLLILKGYHYLFPNS